MHSNERTWTDTGSCRVESFKRVTLTKDFMTCSLIDSCTKLCGVCKSKNIVVTEMHNWIGQKIMHLTCPICRYEIFNLLLILFVSVLSSSSSFTSAITYLSLRSQESRLVWSQLLRIFGLGVRDAVNAASCFDPVCGGHHFCVMEKREEMMKSELPKHTSSAIEPIIEETNADFTTCQFDLTWNSSCGDVILFRMMKRESWLSARKEIELHFCKCNQVQSNQSIPVPCTSRYKSRPPKWKILFQAQENSWERWVQLLRHKLQPTHHFSPKRASHKASSSYPSIQYILAGFWCGLFTELRSSMSLWILNMTEMATSSFHVWQERLVQWPWYWAPHNKTNHEVLNCWGRWVGCWGTRATRTAILSCWGSFLNCLNPLIDHHSSSPNHDTTMAGPESKKFVENKMNNPLHDYQKTMWSLHQKACPVELP